MKGSEMKRGTWTENESRRLEELLAKNTNEEIAAILGRDVASVQNKINQLQLKRADVVHPGIVELVYNDRPVRTAFVNTPKEVAEAVLMWFHDIRPALKRGEKITLDIRLKQ